MFNKKKRFKHKKKFNGKHKDRNDYFSTFDPKLHHKSKGSTGYGLKRGVSTDPAADQGSTLAHLFDKWKN